MSLHFWCQASYIIRSTSYCMVHFILHASRFISNHTPNIVSFHIYVISRSFYHISSHIILARGSSAFPRTPKTLRFQIWVSLNEALTVPKNVCWWSIYLHQSTMAVVYQKRAIYLYIYINEEMLYIYIVISDNCWHLKIPFCWYKTFPVDGFQLLFFFWGGYVYRLFQEMPLAAALVSSTLPSFRELSSWGWCISLVNENQRRSPEISEILKITGSSNILCKYLKI